MKKILLTAAIIAVSLAYQQDANAQISFNVNIGSQPDWGPVGYDHAEYYYMPDIDTYYSVPTRQYVYYDNNRWTRSGSLPLRYRDYDAYNNYKVVINEPTPWNNANAYRSKYASYRGGSHNQVIIRDSRDVKYLNRGQTKKVMRENNNYYKVKKFKGNKHGKGH